MKTITEFQQFKRDKRRISMVTVYDYTSARLVAQSKIDVLLVGDSAAMVMHGHPHTVQADLSMMIAHTAAVARAQSEKLIVADIPFPLHRLGPVKALEAAAALLQAGATAVKIEGASGHLDTIHHLIESGVPVVAHLGLTPQSVHQLGGYKVQAREQAARAKLLADAQDLERVGCCALVLECIPADLAAEVTGLTSMPTIGIGSGPDCDGQVLVWQDLLGLNIDFKPKFVRRFAQGAAMVSAALDAYHEAVLTGAFPDASESF